MVIEERIVATAAEFVFTHSTLKVHTSSFGKVISIFAGWAD